MQKSIFLIATIFILSSCSMLKGQSAGKTDVWMKSFVDANGNRVCCEFHLKSGKNYKTFEFEMTKSPDGAVKVKVKEKGVSASDPIEASMRNQGKLLDVISGLVPAIKSKIE